MKVKDLIKRLEEINPDANVEFEMTVFTYDLGIFPECRCDVENINTCGLDPKETSIITLELG